MIQSYKLGRLLALAVLTTVAAWPAAETPEGDGEDARSAFLAQFEWVKGPGKAKVGTVAEVQVPAGHMYTGAKGAQALLQAMGNPTDGSEMGFFAPTSMVWFVVFEWSDVGYVKDDDKDKLDGDKMLASIREGNESANEWRRENGQAELRVTGWSVPPRYNEETHNLEWAIKGESEGEPVVNYNVRMLGRKGVMSAVLLVDPAKMEAVLPEYRAMLADYRFVQGQAYAEYRQGDKLAKYGLAALVVGGAAAGAAKLGLFAWLAVFLKKGWKLLVVVVAAVAAGVRKLFWGRRTDSTV